MCRHSSTCPCVAVEEAVAADECLVVYCKPVELYNILHRRAQCNPSFLPRCLSYKIEARWNNGAKNGHCIFNYRDQNHLLRKTEVARHFSCPFCLMQCGSFKGLRYHLSASHDLFNFEFWATEEYRAVNVSVKADDLLLESPTEESDPQLQSFCLCSKPRKRKRPVNPLDRGKHIYTQVLEPTLPTVPTDLHRGTVESHEGENFCRNGNGNGNGTDSVAANSNLGVPVARAQSLDDTECVENISGDKPVPSTPAQNGKSRKLTFERTDSRSSMLLQKRQFYHSHRAQPMSLEQVLADRDSENEVDDDIAKLEDRRMLDDFVDVTKDEKHLMHLWNSFVRKQRVLADGHIPWACEAFCRLHGKNLVGSPALFWCWRLFTIKLWNHGLLDAITLNNCSSILLKHRDEGSPDKEHSDNCIVEP